ncbi:carbamate kinase [Providencia hangzhouensis]|uniref:Carbamate kinase n=1 Tax=Providencia rettgeri TaxID=587 RepID=A0AAW6UMM1_PRORE|nr:MULTISPECIES: carbamate kinase [Providencia]MRF67682.1 carbamate kinase [Escherichia coli]AVE40389.1 carbamate kinase [Providencia stuartii]EHZ6873480.1 carbamate kinase [Providencia rettgeri]EMA4784135.1 carbamate kinase [Providencia rettgeri]MBG5892267.1 carbamate kinase [Providencia rettgeri]
METIVIALGGNALLQRGEVLSAENQYQAIASIAGTLGQLAQKYRVVIVHGNGPQVGLLALQNLAYTDVPAYPLDILVAESQGMIGYMLMQELGRKHPKQPVATLLTRVEVDSNDPAYQNPTKYIGPVYDKQEKESLEAELGWAIKPDGKYYRRVVPSPQPKAILEIDAIKCLLDQKHIVICNGGGGVPVIQQDNGFCGSEVVIDKDLSSALLAEVLESDHLIILTDADAVYRNWGTPEQSVIRCATVAEVAPMAIDDGSMGPKLMAVSRFVQRSGKPAYIGALKQIDAILKGEAGTRIIP